MNLTRSKTSLLYVFIIFCLLSAVIFSNFITSGRTEDQLNRLVSEIMPLNDLVDRLLVDLINMETGLRGYELSGDEKYLEPYDAGRFQLAQDLRSIEAHRHINGRLDTLLTHEALPAVERLQSHYASQISLMRNGRKDEAIPRVQDGKAYMDKFRDIQKNMKAEIELAAEDARQSAKRSERLSRIIMVLGGAAAVIAGILSLFIHKRATCAETALRKSEQSYRDMAESLKTQNRLIGNILESTHEGMIMCDSSGRIVYINRRMKTHFGFLSETGEPVIAAIQAWNKAAASLEELLQGQREQYTERISYKTNDGTLRHVELYAAKAGGPSKQPDAGFLIVLRDRTEEEHMDKMKDEFISTISHELRTPLTSVLGFIEIMLYRPLTPEKQISYLQTVYKEAGRLSMLIDDFLDLQRMESGKHAYRFLPVELGALLREAVDPWKAGYTHEINLHLPDHEVWVQADAERLLQAARNLISNAVKYSPQASHVDVRLMEHGGFARFDVQDYGLGIPDEARSQLFTKFFRVDNSDRRLIGGTGLGLSIAREIVEAHRGTIGFESAMGQGSVFTVSLPSRQSSADKDRMARAEDKKPS